MYACRLPTTCYAKSVKLNAQPNNFCQPVSKSVVAKRRDDGAGKCYQRKHDENDNYSVITKSVLLLNGSRADVDSPTRSEKPLGSFLWLICRPLKGPALWLTSRTAALARRPRSSACAAVSASADSQRSYPQIVQITQILLGMLGEDPPVSFTTF
jgi:hypothetical protein